MKKMIKLAHAMYDENGEAGNGKTKPGDQTGKEVGLTNWFNNEKKPWAAVLRPKNKKVAEKIAKTAIQIALNDFIGYNQYRRTTLYYKAKLVDFIIKKIKDNCETDCSAMVAVCSIAAGLKVNPEITTANEVAALLATGGFEKLTDKKYLNSEQYLRNGDILWRPGHTAVVVDYVPVKTITPKSSAMDIKWLQIHLNEQIKAKKINCALLKVDGGFGQKTANAVRLWKQYKNWKEGTGFSVGTKTIESLK